MFKLLSVHCDRDPKTNVFFIRDEFLQLQSNVTNEKDVSEPAWSKETSV